MAKKVIKRKKLKIFRLLLLLLVVGVVCFGVKEYLNTKIENIIIKNTTYLNDDYILELAGIKDYPSFFYTSSRKIKNKILESPYVEKVKVKKSFYHIVTIAIDEAEALFINSINNTVVFSNKEEVPVNEVATIFRVPRLLNSVPSDKYNSLIKETKKIDASILGKISEFEYQPNEYDKDRFLLYMDDGNIVYLTLTKFKNINYYNEVLPQLEGKKGILYLDSGNHFKIME